MNRFYPSRMLMAAAFAFSVAAVPMAALAQAGTDQKPPATAPADYKIGPEDVLTIITRDMPEASGDFMVRPDGTLSFPIVGTINAAGRTPSDLQNQLTDALKKELRDPVVTVNVKQMRINRIYILGIVSHPGLYDYKPGWRMTELIASAGGLATVPERLTAVLFRPNTANKTVSMKDLFVDGKDEANVSLMPGDVVNVRADPTIRINVLGSVGHPGQFEILDGQGAAEAVSAAGGATTEAALSKAVIHRGTDDLKVNLYDVMVKGHPNGNVALKTGDSVYVPQVFERISVVGDVQHPGTHAIPDGRPYTLTDAVSDAGGPAQKAKLDGVIIGRQGPDGKLTQIPVNYKNLGKSQADVVLQDKDVIFIPQSGKADAAQTGSLMNLWFLLKNLLK